MEKVPIEKLEDHWSTYIVLDEYSRLLKIHENTMQVSVEFPTFFHKLSNCEELVNCGSSGSKFTLYFPISSANSLRLLSFFNLLIALPTSFFYYRMNNWMFYLRAFLLFQLLSLRILAGHPVFCVLISLK